jgi:hypothetical protein
MNLKIKLLYCLLALSIAGSCFAEEKNYAHYLVVKGNFSTNYYAFSDLDHTKRATGFEAGLLYDFWFTKNLAVSTEVLYLKKKFDLPVMNFNYVCFDILFKVSSSKSVYGVIGAGLDILVKRNYDPEHVKVNKADISLILGLGFYLNLWKQAVFLNGEIRVRTAFTRVEFASWGKRYIATTSVEVGLAFPISK